MKNKITDWIQDKFLAVTVLYIFFQAVMLFVKLIYLSLQWKYVLIPLWIFLVYFSLLFVISSIRKEINNGMD
jgi:ABC-type bacteriocin/lantibiotic exporter with double-glycine peptidase domain